MGSAPVLTHCKPNKQIKVSADWSSNGLRGILLQKQGKNWRPIFYALMETEQEHAQVEKEALVITWSCKKFTNFLRGLPRFTVKTDHKLLLAFLNSKKVNEVTLRIQHFCRRLLRFSYNTTHSRKKPHHCRHFVQSTREKSSRRLR